VKVKTKSKAKATAKSVTTHGTPGQAEDPPRRAYSTKGAKEKPKAKSQKPTANSRFSITAILAIVAILAITLFNLPNYKSYE